MIPKLLFIGNFFIIEEKLLYKSGITKVINAKVTKIEKLRIDMGLLAGIIEKSSECPSSYGSYQCYYSSTYNNRADYEYTFNYGLVLHATYDRITLGVSSTGESTQLLLGINF